MFHDWDSGRGNVDHFVIGPQGVFVVETKAFTGEITCQDGRLLRNGRPIPGKDVTKQAMAEAMAVRDLLRATSGIEAFVHPILCFSDAHLSCFLPLNGVEMTNVGSLNRYIVTQWERYSTKEVRAIAHLLEKRLGVGPAAGPDLPPQQPSRIGALPITKADFARSHPSDFSRSMSSHLTLRYCLSGRPGPAAQVQKGSTPGHALRRITRRIRRRPGAVAPPLPRRVPPARHLSPGAALPPRLCPGPVLRGYRRSA